MKVRITPCRGDGHDLVVIGPSQDIELTDALSRGAIMRRIKTLVGWRGKHTFTVDNGDTIDLRSHGEDSVIVVQF